MNKISQIHNLRHTELIRGNIRTYFNDFDNYFLLIIPYGSHKEVSQHQLFTWRHKEPGHQQQSIQRYPGILRPLHISVKWFRTESYLVTVLLNVQLKMSIWHKFYGAETLTPVDDTCRSHEMCGIQKPLVNVLELTCPIDGWPK